MKYFLSLTTLFLLFSCNSKPGFDAAGNFEADEVIVSAEQTGNLLSFPVTEGTTLEAGQAVGQIDVGVQKLQKEQTQATISTLHEKTVTAAPQIEVVKKQLAAQLAQLQHLSKEQERTQNLVAADAAPRRQLDDIDAQITELQRQMAVTRQQINVYASNASIQNRGILSEKAPLEKSAEQFQLQIQKGQIINPVTGVVLIKYAMQGEMATIGRPLYKIANIDTLLLKAYITGEQLPAIKLGQRVTVRIDNNDKSYKNYSGTILWIADKAEFTPKTIQTKNERSNLVYAIKIRVKNDGYLKIGMYGEVLFTTKK